MQASVTTHSDAHCTTSTAWPKLGSRSLAQDLLGLGHVAWRMAFHVPGAPSSSSTSTACSRGPHAWLAQPANAQDNARPAKTLRSCQSRYKQAGEERKWMSCCQKQARCTRHGLCRRQARLAGRCDAPATTQRFHHMQTTLECSVTGHMPRRREGTEQKAPAARKRPGAPGTGPTAGRPGPPAAAVQYGRRPTRTPSKSPVLTPASCAHRSASSGCQPSVKVIHGYAGENNSRLPACGCCIYESGNADAHACPTQPRCGHERCARVRRVCRRLGRHRV